MQIRIFLAEDNGDPIGMTASIPMSSEEVIALRKFCIDRVGRDYTIATWCKDAVEIGLEACGALDGIPTKSISDRLAKFSFKLEQTGGGCTAFMRNDGEIEEILTVSDDPTAPTSLTDDVAVGTRNVDESDEYDTIKGYTLADVLAALENPSDEYFLLSLRLYNNLHKAGR